MAKSKKEEAAEEVEVASTDKTIMWEKPNGNKIQTNAEKATIEHCESLGWKRKK